MPAIIGYRDVTPDSNEFHFSTEASTLGWRPGYTPHYVPTTLGNGLDFVLLRRDKDGTLHYRQSCGCIFLTVFND